MPGTKVKIWKQDPTVAPIGVRSVYIHTRVDDGPEDEEITISGMPEVRHNADNDFLFNQNESPKEFDAVHTFTIVRQVLTMYKRALKRMGFEDNFTWQWGEGNQIHVHPRGGLDVNAFYNRNEKSLKFFYFHPQDDESKPLVYTCRSFDIVAHETGHAVLDALRPGYWNSWHSQTGGLHESFGDLTSIFTMLSQMDQCEAIIAESKLDLHKKTFFPAVAEQFGAALYGNTLGLRNADNDLKLSEVSTEVHDISQIFTGAVYDILADIFSDHLDLEKFDPAETLFRVGQHMTAVVILGLLKGPAANATYKDVAEKMIEIEPDENWKTFIKNRFAEREVIGGPAGLAAPKPTKLSWKGCCGTMQHPDHSKAVDDAVKKAGGTNS